LTVSNTTGYPEVPDHRYRSEVYPSEQVAFATVKIAIANVQVVLNINVLKVGDNLGQQIGQFCLHLREIDDFSRRAPNELRLECVFNHVFSSPDPLWFEPVLVRL
jgi:hypothetical protein